MKDVKNEINAEYFALGTRLATSKMHFVSTAMLQYTEFMYRMFVCMQYTELRYRMFVCIQYTEFMYRMFVSIQYTEFMYRMFVNGNHWLQ